MVIWNIIFAQLAAAAAANMGKYEDSPPRLRQPLSEFMPAMLLSFTSMSLLLLLLKDTSSFLFSLPISLCLCRFLCLCLALTLHHSLSLSFPCQFTFFPDLFLSLISFSFFSFVSLSLPRLLLQYTTLYLFLCPFSNYLCFCFLFYSPSLFLSPSLTL